MLVKAFVKYLKMAAGQCVLVAGIVLGIMLLPYVVSTCQESLVNAKRTYEKSGLALGLSREYVLIKVILPAIRPGNCSKCDDGIRTCAWGDDGSNDGDR